MYDHHIPTASRADRQTLFALNELIGATRALAATLKTAALALHGEQSLTVSQRSLLWSLKKSGPATVPTLARDRGVSRQYIQATANPLLAAGILITQANPAHRRSSFLAITPRGVELIRLAMRKEGDLMGHLAQDMSAEDIKLAAQTLVQVNKLMSRVVG